MKRRFLEYLLESDKEQIQDDDIVDESAFKNDDFAKDDYKYLKPVIDDIVDNKKIGIGDKTIEQDIIIDKKVAS